MKFSARQLRFLLLGLLGLCVITIFTIAVLGLNVLSSKSSELVELKVKTKTLDAQLVNLDIAKKQVEQYSYFNEVAKTVLPADKDQAKAVLTVFKLANESGISIANITFPSSALGGNAGSRSATSSPSSAISQAKPVEGIKGLYSLQLTITPQTGASGGKTVTYDKFIDFLKRIERDRRTAQITQVIIKPELGTNAIDFTLVINIFMRPAK